MTWSQFRAFLEKRKAQGLPVGVDATRPQLFADLLPTFQAFNFLSRRRLVGMAPTPIELGEITTYLDEWLIFSADRRQEMITLIDALDDEWLKWAREPKKT